MARKNNVIAVMSPKGGVGKTVTTANLAAALSQEFDKKVLAIDTNVSTASLGLHLDIFYPRNTIQDIATKGFSIRKAIHVYDKNLHVIPASIKIQKKDKNIHNVRKNTYKLISNYENILEELADDYDLVLLDSAPGFDMESVAALNVAGGLLLVTNPDYPSMITAAKAIEYARSLRVPMGGIVLNKVDNREHELQVDEIEDALNVKVIEQIPFDRRIPESIAHRTPIVLYRPGTESSRAFKRLAGSLVGEEYNDHLLRRILGY